MIDNLTEAIERYKDFAECETESARVLREYGNEKDAKYFEETAENDKKIIAWLTELQERREADGWIPVSERLPEEKKDTNTKDFAEVLCTTIFGGVRLYKYGTRIGDKQAHFWYGFGIFDSEITAWKYLPEPYESEAENE